MTETIAEIKARLYPQRKAAVLKHVECYRDRLLSIADGADEENEELINIPVGMAYALVDVCNFVERLDSYGIVDPMEETRVAHAPTCATRAYSGRPNKCNCGVAP